jgi:coenzyme A diphosphatase NUDT7
LNRIYASPPTYQPRVAGVLVLLYEEHDQIRVLVTTRAKHLRTHAGQTALPGGKKDSTDIDLVMTAVRSDFVVSSDPLSQPRP